MLHPGPQDVLVIGLGDSVTPGAASQHPVKLDIVELSDGVRQAARYFAHVNYDVLRQPNVQLRVDDGRSVTPCKRMARGGGCYRAGCPVTVHLSEGGKGAPASQGDGLAGPRRLV